MPAFVTKSDLINRVCSTCTRKHILHFADLAVGGDLDQLFSKLFAFLVDQSGKRRSPQFGLGMSCEVIGRSAGAEHVEIAIAETAGWIVEIFDSFLLIGLYRRDCLLKQRLGLGGGA